MRQLIAMKASEKFFITNYRNTKERLEDYELEYAMGLKKAEKAREEMEDNQK